MYRHIPNLITVGRLLLTVLFFVLINIHRPETFVTTMWASFVLFVVAGLTDILDGYLARTWKVESAFGRVVDPFVDKIMVCGAFILFASNGFAQPSGMAWGETITGVAPWMAVVLIAREFLITGIRGLAESRGIDFRADWAGKIKMFSQSFAIGSILVDLATSYVPGTGTGSAAAYRHVGWIITVRDISIWLTLVVTVASATTYIVRAQRLFREPA